VVEERPMLRIVEVSSPPQIEQARSLFREYQDEFAESIQASLCFQQFDAEVADLPGRYATPAGRLLVAEIDGELVGCVGMRPLGEGVCEMKRLFVRPGHRGRGVGVELIRHVMQAAKDAGYRLMRLDTLPEMEQAAQLYRSFGFEPIGPYYENPVGRAIYFEADLAMI
jgi:putative acetyltransferase